MGIVLEKLTTINPFSLCCIIRLMLSC